MLKVGDVAPDFKLKTLDGKQVKGGDELDGPALHMEWQDQAQNVTASTILPLGGATRREGLSFQFPELRRWSSFRVVDDPGYPVVLVSFWLGLLALLVRYMPEMLEWFKREV